MDNAHDREAYFKTRLQHDGRRSVLWRTLVDAYFAGLVPPSSCVVDLGAGWCDFINHVRARRRIAVDAWPGFTGHAAPGVETHVAPVTDLSFIADGSADVVFASNLVEHLERAEFAAMLGECARLLTPQGRLLLLQPNYRLCPGRYFDDYTHVSVWTDVSLADFLRSRAWRVELVEPRFLPLSLRSRFPVAAPLVRAYLRSPLKPLAGQMLVIARPPLTHGDSPRRQAGGAPASGRAPEGHRA